MAVFSALSIYAVASGTDIKNLGTLEFGIQDNRLFPIYHFSEGGILCGVSIAVAAVGLCMAKQKTIKTIYAVCALLTFICGSLTLARAEYILNAVTLSAFSCIFISRHLKTSGFWRRKVPLTLAAVLLIVAVSAVQVPLTKMMIGVLQPGNKSRTGASLPEKVQQMIIPSAKAETAEQDEEQKEIEPLISRSYDFSNGLDALLNGRVGIWESGIHVFTEQPEILLTGRSVIWTMDPIWAYRESKGLFLCAHLHNIILQIILENGLPALLFFLLFTGYFFRRAYLLFRNKELPLWERIIGLPAVLCFVADMVDITCHVDRGLPQMTLLYLFAGLTVALSWIEMPRKKRLNRKPVPDTCNDGE